MYIGSMVPSKHLILCCPLLLLSSIFSSIRVFSNESALCNPMNCSTPGFPVLHCLLEFAQTHVHWAGDSTQPSHPLSPPSPPALNLSQHQGHFQWLGSSLLSGGQSIGASASFLPMNIQGLFLLRLTGVISLQSKGLLRVFYSNTTSALSLLCPHLN